MIALRRVAICGHSSGGRFEGELAFQAGVQVVSGPNGYGKSLAASAIAWCLGLEPIYGVPANDNAIFKDAVRNRIDLEDAPDSQVIWSQAVLELELGQARTLQLRRSIVGGDLRQIEFVISEGDSERTGKLLTGWGAMSDPTAGFQGKMFEWAGMPVKPLMTVQGKERPLYFENLAPLFYVEQLEGWTDIQTLQVHRYQLLDVREAAFEYLLGLDDTLKQRFDAQSASAREQELRREVDAVVKRTNDLIIQNGFDRPIHAPRSGLRQIAEFFDKFSLQDYLRSEFDWSFVGERQRVSAKLEALRNRLNSVSAGSDGVSSEAVSTRVLDLKQEISREQADLRQLRYQLTGQQRLIASLDERIKSARDLLRLKQTNVGILEKAECPTCHQHIDPGTYNLAVQGPDGIAAYVDTLERDREALVRSLATANVQAEVLAARLKKLEDDYFLEQQRLRGVNSAVGPEREALVNVASEIVATERALDRNREAHREVGEIEALIKGLSARLTRAVALADAVKSRADLHAVASFVERFSQFVVDLGHSAVTPQTAAAVTVDEEYVPHLGDRRLRSLGSASDRARLVLAYTLALMEQALAGGGHHPGFVFYDEPLQQNPDPEHRQRFREFLARDWASLKGQVVIFTSLSDEDTEYLDSKQVPYMTVSGKKFLSRVQA